MAKRDPELTARNKRINEITSCLEEMLDDVLQYTGCESILSLNGKIGGKHLLFFDIRHEVILHSDQFIALWFEGLMKYLDESRSQSIYDLLQKIQKSELFESFVLLFLERTFLRHYKDLSKVRPKPEDSIIWIGQENANYGLLVTPRFRNGQWGNDGSEIRKFKPNYFTIGHVMETGLVIPNVDEKMTFRSIEEYLNFFKNVLVRNSGSKYEYEIAEKYCKCVLSKEKPEEVPLLIPEFRYGGIEKRHKYRLDFTIINPFTIEKFGFELSPWSSHGQLTGTKNKSQKEINLEASANFDKEMTKHKDYYKVHGVYAFIYTDSDLADLNTVFEDIKEFLEPERRTKQLKIETLEKFRRYEYSFEQ